MGSQQSVEEQVKRELEKLMGRYPNTTPYPNTSPTVDIAKLVTEAERISASRFFRKFYLDVEGIVTEPYLGPDFAGGERWYDMVVDPGKVVVKRRLLPEYLEEWLFQAMTMK